MKCILVFDQLNDLIYTKHNKKFAQHINAYVTNEDLDSLASSGARLHANMIVQIFAPIVTSQRIMSCQFGNSYTSIQCKDGLNMTFENYMGYLFVCIARENVSTMKHLLNICVAMVRFMCGPNVSMLKIHPQLATRVTKLIDSCTLLQNTEQAIFIEAVEQLMLNHETTSATLMILQEAMEKLRCQTEAHKCHAMIIVENKLVALYSSPNATDLSPSDIIFLQVLCQSFETTNESGASPTEAKNADNEFYSPPTSPVAIMEAIFEADYRSQIISQQVLLAGPDNEPKCVPNAVHIRKLSGKGSMFLVMLLEVGVHPTIPPALYNSFSNLHALQMAQIQRQAEIIRPAFDNLDSSLKKLSDGLKKLKFRAIEEVYKQLGKIWDFMKKKYLEFLKSGSLEALLRAESSTSTLLNTLKDILELIAFDHTLLNSSKLIVDEISSTVEEKLSSYSEFFKVKTLRNFTLGSYPFKSNLFDLNLKNIEDFLMILKYLEEFPGLVHFIYIDRNIHRVTTPSLAFNSEQTNVLTKQKIWSMVDFSRIHLQEGHLSLMWKDTTFNYAYFLWFEELSGAPLKPCVFPTHASKVLPQPGIICGDFYQKLKVLCFPKMSSAKICCYELFCIHLGLATASCVLEHTRRLAATIWELRGHPPNHPMDLL